MKRCLIATALPSAAGITLAQSAVTLCCLLDISVGNVKSVSTTQVEIGGNIRITGRLLEASA